VENLEEKKEVGEQVSHWHILNPVFTKKEDEWGKHMRTTKPETGTGGGRQYRAGHGRRSAASGGRTVRARCSRRSPSRARAVAWNSRAGHAAPCGSGGLDRDMG
jgi:hypothetical protein